MDIKENIKNLWDTKCLNETKDKILDAIADDGRCKSKTALSARQRYFYDVNISEEEAPVILDIMHNALRAQNQGIEKMLIEQ